MVCERGTCDATEVSCYHPISVTTHNLSVDRLCKQFPQCCDMCDLSLLIQINQRFLVVVEGIETFIFVHPESNLSQLIL